MRFASARRVALVTSSTVAVLSLLPACSSSGTGGVHGPVFGLDGGGDVATDHFPDATTGTDAKADQTAPRDSGHPADVAPQGDVGTMTHPDAGRDAMRSDTGLDSGPLPDATADHNVTHEAGGGSDASVCPSGGGNLALLGGTLTLGFGAVSKAGGPWAVTSFAGVNVGARPALDAVAGGVVGVFSTSPSTDMLSTHYMSSAWSAPAAIPALAGSDAAATEIAAPSLAVLGANAELVYQGSNNHFYHGVYSGSTWGPASDAVGGSTSQDYGPSGPAAATAGSTLFAAYDGANNGLYVDSWTSGGGWAGAQAVGGAGVGTVPPSMTTLTGGTPDLMIVYEAQTTNVLSSSVHTPGSGAGTWATPVVVNAVATTGSAVSLAPLPNGGAVMVYLGSSDQLPYFSIYSPTATPAWTTPAKVNPNSQALASAPVVVAGTTCGVDAIAALVEAVGVEIVTLKAGAWSSPVLVPGTASMSFATLAAF